MGCHAVEVEVDIETCGVRILRYVVVNDSGRVINPMIVEGQIVGGVAHGIGNALLELMAYDEQAQPMTTTFADYLLPGSTEVPNIEVTFAEYPVAAQSARRQGRRRIRLRAGGRRDRLGDRERAVAVRRADQRISGDAGRCSIDGANCSGSDLTSHPRSCGCPNRRRRECYQEVCGYWMPACAGMTALKPLALQRAPASTAAVPATSPVRSAPRRPARSR